MDIFSPLQGLADSITYRVFELSPGSRLGMAVNFFAYDYPKVLILLAVIIFLVSLGRSFLPAEKVRDFLVRQNPFWAHLAAAGVGILTPFCTCSAVSLFLGFVEAGIPLRIAFSFLVASPMINEVALVLLIAMFGVKVAVIYVACGLVIAVASGFFIGLFDPEKLLIAAGSKSGKSNALPSKDMTAKERLAYAGRYTGQMLDKTWLAILVGIGAGAWMHGYVPNDFLAKYAGGHSWWSVPLATVVGVPLYSSAAGLIPLVGVLTEKGVSLGTSLAFMMAVTGLSFPEFIILKTVMTGRLITIFASIVTIGIMGVGFLFNFIF